MRDDFNAINADDIQDILDADYDDSQAIELIRELLNEYWAANFKSI